MSAAAAVAVAPQHSFQQQPAISFRSLQPNDFEELKAAHAALFPIDYDDSFFIRATQGLDRIWSCAAVSTDPYGGGQQLVGFITAKSVLLHEVDASDRQHMGLLSAVLDHDRALYVMTLGVVEAHRGRGLATTLVAIACQHASEMRCRAVFLHVITYNAAAMSLYTRQGFSCVARLRGFYYIATGRTPDPHQQVYDAYLFVLWCGGAAGMPSPWDLVSLAWSPLRLALNRLNACIPGFCRAEEHPQHEPLLNGQSTAAWDAHSSTASSQPQQQPPAGRHQQQQQHVLHVRPEQAWQRLPALPAPPGSRQRHRGPSLPGSQQQQQQQHSHAYQQQQQAHWQQEDVTMQPAPLHLQDQQQWQYGPGALRQQHQQHAYAVHQTLQPPQQRMLRWLFNPACRGVAGAGERHMYGKQQAAAGTPQEWCADLEQQHKQG